MNVHNANSALAAQNLSLFFLYGIAKEVSRLWKMNRIFVIQTDDVF